MKPHGFLALATLLTLPQTSPAAAGDSIVIEEVVVTARKREEGLLEAPLSVSALSRSELQRLQVDDLGGLQRVVPNLALNMGDAANAIIYVRGVGQRDSLSFADPGVGVYLDDVYLGRAQGAFLDVIDVERIEVLRGPQGTLYGRNTIGGAIKYVSARPSQEPLFDVEAGFGNYDERMAKAVLSGPLGDGGNLLGRVTVAYGAHDGYTDNSHPPAGDTDGDRDSLAWRAQLNYAPNDEWAFNLALDQSVSDPRRSVTPARVTSGPVLVAATVAKEPSADPFEVEADFNDLEKLEVQGASLGMEYAITESVALKSVTAWREVEHRTHIDLDGTGFPIFGVLVDQDQEQFSQEIQLSFASGQAFTGLVGAYWFSEEDVTPDGINNSEPIDFAFGGGFFLPYNTVSENDQRIEAGAVFGELSWLAGNRIELTAGLRYTDETRRLKRKACQAFSPVPLDIEACDPPPGSLNPFGLRLSLKDSFDAFTPKLGISYDSDAAGLIYFNWARGFKSGGFDGRIGYNGASSAEAVDTQAEAYDPEIADTFELGWKTGSADGSWRFSAAAFFNDYTDLQLSSFSATPSGGFATVFTNAGKAETIGAEFELLARPSANLLLSASLGWLDADYKEFIDATQRDLADERTPIHAPDWTANLAAQYEVPMEFGRLRISADLAYRSKYYVEINNLEALAQNGFALLNAAVALEDLAGRWEVSFGVKNLTDKAYITHGFDLTAFPGIGLAYHGAPRTYRVRASYRFL